MPTTDPLTLRLPSWLRHSFDLARAIASDRRACRFDHFDMRSHERAFVKTVLARRSNLWLFRTNQRRWCGDFIALDMSCARRASRRAYVMELKMGGRLVVGGAHLQCAHYEAAIGELVARAILDDRSRVELLHGDGAAIIEHLGG
jgi:hypothetical protein